MSDNYNRYVSTMSTPVKPQIMDRGFDENKENEPSSSNTKRKRVNFKSNDKLLQVKEVARYDHSDISTDDYIEPYPPRELTEEQKKRTIEHYARLEQNKQKRDLQVFKRAEKDGLTFGGLRKTKKHRVTRRKKISRKKYSTSRKRKTYKKNKRYSKSTKKSLLIKTKKNTRRGGADNKKSVQSSQQMNTIPSIPQNPTEQHNITVPGDDLSFEQAFPEITESELNSLESSLASNSWASHSSIPNNTNNTSYNSGYTTHEDISISNDSINNAFMNGGRKRKHRKNIMK
jgi:hypothetical protein